MSSPIQTGQNTRNWRFKIRKNKNTFAKLQRERQKKRKAEEKRQRKLERKNNPLESEAESSNTPQLGSETDDEVEQSENTTDTDNEIANQ